MANLRDWLQLFRSHTSPLEITIMVMGAALGYGTFFRWEILLWALGGWLYHNTGYGQNSVEDYAFGFDMDDPHKSHHPLQRGAITIKSGRITVYTLMLFWGLFAIYLTGFRPVALVCIFVVLVAGVIYNIWGKRLSLKAVPIALAHSLLFPYAFFSTAALDRLPSADTFAVLGNLLDTDVGKAMVLSTLFLVIQVIYQIMIEGDLKDLGQKEASVLERLGVRIEGRHFMVSIGGTIFSLLLKTLNILPAFAVAYLLGASTWVYPVLMAFSVLIIYMERRLMAVRIWDHNITTRDMAIMEILTLFTLLFALQPSFGWAGILTLIGLDIAYFVAMNRFLWKTSIRPAV